MKNNHNLRIIPFVAASLFLMVFIPKEAFSKGEPSVEEKRVIDFVNNAANYIKEVGKDNALIEFNKKDGQFINGNDAIFAIDYNGVFLATDNNPELNWTNQIDLKDDEGRYPVRNEIAKAKAGGGWVVFRWKNPANNQMECKKSYVIPILTPPKNTSTLPLPSGSSVGNDYLIGSGYYYSPNAEGKCE
jgi:hypothetical protein